mgnify:CR=1 FL=1
MFSFTIKNSSQFWDVTGYNKIPVMITFNGVTGDDQKSLESATLHYYVLQETETTCEIDRFDCYPL